MNFIDVREAYNHHRMFLTPRWGLVQNCQQSQTPNRQRGSEKHMRLFHDPTTIEKLLKRTSAMWIWADQQKPRKSRPLIRTVHSERSFRERQRYHKDARLKEDTTALCHAFCFPMEPWRCQRIALISPVPCRGRRQTATQVLQWLLHKLGLSRWFHSLNKTVSFSFLWLRAQSRESKESHHRDKCCNVVGTTPPCSDCTVILI